MGALLSPLLETPARRAGPSRTLAAFLRLPVGEGPLLLLVLLDARRVPRSREIPERRLLKTQARLLFCGTAPQQPRRARLISPSVILDLPLPSPSLFRPQRVPRFC